MTAQVQRAREGAGATGKDLRALFRRAHGRSADRCRLCCRGRRSTRTRVAVSAGAGSARESNARRWERPSQDGRATANAGHSPASSVWESGKSASGVANEDGSACESGLDLRERRREGMHARGEARRQSEDDMCSCEWSGYSVAGTTKREVLMRERMRPRERTGRRNENERPESDN